MSLWDGLFQHMDQPIAQILLTKNDIADVCNPLQQPLTYTGPDTDRLSQRTRYLNAQNTFNSLLDMGVIPIVNENDTLAVSEIKFGDNDTLSAITAAMIHADHLFLMTDVDCLYDKNPRTNPDAQPIEVVPDISQIHADGMFFFRLQTTCAKADPTSSVKCRLITRHRRHEHQNHCRQTGHLGRRHSHHYPVIKSR